MASLLVMAVIMGERFVILCILKIRARAGRPFFYDKVISIQTPQGHTWWHQTWIWWSSSGTWGLVSIKGSTKVTWMSAPVCPCMWMRNNESWWHCTGLLHENLELPKYPPAQYCFSSKVNIFSVAFSSWLQGLRVLGLFMASQCKLNTVSTIA